VLRDGVGVLVALALGGVVCVGSHWWRGVEESGGDRLTRHESERMRLDWWRMREERDELRRALDFAEVTIGAQRELVLLLAADQRAAPRLGDAPEDRIPPQNVPTGN
jgi:hypothetical protein